MVVLNRCSCRSIANSQLLSHGTTSLPYQVNIHLSECDVFLPTVVNRKDARASS